MADQKSASRRAQETDKNGVLMILTSEKGYSLKKRCLKRWIYVHGYTQSFIARKLGISVEEFKRKLREHEKFNEYQITKLVALMKARAAFRVLYFPSIQIRRRIYQEVFGSGRG